jgi:hypothetical protein
MATRRAWVCQRMVPTRRGAGLGSWRLDGPHAVSARKEEQEAMREALSLGAWRQHRGSAAALTAVDRCSRVMRRLGGNAACQRFAGEAAGEGMRQKLTEAWMEHLDAGRGRNFTGGQRGGEQT